MTNDEVYEATKDKDTELLWLAMYQVGRMPFSKIAEQFGESVETVEKACKEMAGFIGLPLREEK